jgi:Arc/MetJ-type ribon-helix-helix transcriptional regulator
MSEQGRPDGQDPPGTDPVGATVALLAETAEAVRVLMDEVKAGRFGRLDELVREQAALRRALGAAIHERQQAERLRREEGQADGENVLDLDAARAEVGRRLARLRATLEGDGAAPAPER